MTSPTPNHPAAGIIATLEAEALRAERIECAKAGMPASDHPVVQRAARVLDAAHARNTVTAAHLTIMTALEHLPADDLRHTPAGRELMAEGRRAALAQLDALARAVTAVVDLHRPIPVYDECDDPECPNDHLELLDYVACEATRIGWACERCCYDGEMPLECLDHGGDHRGVAQDAACATADALTRDRDAEGEG